MKGLMLARRAKVVKMVNNMKVEGRSDGELFVCLLGELRKRSNM